MSNFPPPSGVADEIVAKAIECLDRDIWHELDDTFITIRAVQFYLKDITIKTDGEVSVLKWGKPSAAYQSAFREAYDKAMARKRERLMQPKLKSISDERFGHVPAWLRVVRIGVPIGAVMVSAAVVFGFVSSCSEQERVRAETVRAAEVARENEVNKYGFKRKHILTRKVWPSDCDGSGWAYPGGEHNEFRTIYECRDYWRRWEREGSMWVDWKDEP